MKGQCIRCKNGDFEPFPYGNYICLCKRSERYGRTVDYEDSCDFYEDMQIEKNVNVDFDALHDAINEGFSKGDSNT